MNAKLSSLSLLAAVILLASASQAKAQAYTLTDLTAVAGLCCGNLAINNAGHVAGTSGSHAAVWNGIRTIDLGTLNPEGYTSRASDINDAGQVAGWSQDIKFAYGVRWNGTAASHLYPFLGFLTDASAINEAGQVVGSSEVINYPDPERWHATLWNGTTAPDIGTDLGTLGGLNSQATAINDAGVIAGWAETAAGVQRAVVWNDAIVTELVTPGATKSAATAINNAGQIAGWSDVSDSVRHAALWHGNSFTDLGTLGGNSSQATAINDAGQIVGQAGTTGMEQHAALWEGATATDLNTFLDSSVANAGWVLTVARDINDKGWIVGEAHNARLGINHAFLMAPVPEPGAYAMLMAGLVLVGFVSRRRTAAGLHAQRRNG